MCKLSTFRSAVVTLTELRSINLALNPGFDHCYSRAKGRHFVEGGLDFAAAKDGSEIRARANDAVASYSKGKRVSGTNPWLFQGVKVATLKCCEIQLSASRVTEER